MQVRLIAAITTFISLIFTIYAVVTYDRVERGYQFVTNIAWIPQYGINFHVGMDGISLTMNLLTSFTIFTGVFVSWFIEKRTKEFYFLLITLVTGVFGVFSSMNIFFFYFFYEMAVIPMYLLIGYWGSGNKEYATMKLTIYLTLGAVIALIGILSLYYTNVSITGDHSYEIGSWIKMTQNLTPEYQKIIFPVLLVGFGFIVPMWPFHTWSPGGHAAAPSAVSMLHAGVLMKLGGYAIIRLGLTILPVGAAFWLPVVAVLCVANIVYGGFVAMAQKDMKFIIGYSSSSHMGYVLLGIACLNNWGLNGAVFLMFAHGIMTALTFALIGFFYDQTHTRMTYDLGGLSRQVPFIGVCFTMAAMASSGLPGFANFVSELLIFFAAFQKYPIQAICAVFGIVITATYLLRAVRDAFFGEMNPKWEKIHDANTFVERLPYVTLVMVLLFFGFFPQLLLGVINTGVEDLLMRVNSFL
jgi:NADH-quinone oxidoreductase subunit M